MGRYRTSRKKDERENGGAGCRGTKMREKTGVQCGRIQDVEKIKWDRKREKRN